jgi:glycosyltransferase involved in cell wall biosynthesis
MLLSVITPTILRPSLKETCRSIDDQGFSDYEHIVMVDRPNENLSAINDLRSDKRLFIPCARAHNDFGNSCRHAAFDLAKGDYLFHLDDDDSLAPHALAAIAAAIERHPPAWILFPAKVYGERWLKPPGKGNTVSCQFCYRKDTGLRWPDNANYCADGELVEALLKIAPPMVLDIPECLAIVDKSRYGAEE